MSGRNRGGGPKPKPFVISKWLVLEAWKRVRANQGAAGVDGESVAVFEADLAGNLFKLWNRLSSGSYFPPPVRAVEIPKRAAGGVGSSGCRRSRTGWRRLRCF